jgi:putative membrane protein
MIYATEAGEKPQQERDALRAQFALMMKRLMYGITWPSALLTFVFGNWVLYLSGFYQLLFALEWNWMLVKYLFVLLLYGYHFSLQRIMNQLLRGEYKYSSNQLRLWNEVPTVILLAAIFLVVVKSNISAVWGVLGLLGFVVLLMAGIKTYKYFRNKA